MKANTPSKEVRESKAIEKESDGCELNLSADRKWMRMVIDGKLVASFHVDYVAKVLAGSGKRPSTRISTTTGANAYELPAEK